MLQTSSHYEMPHKFTEFYSHHPLIGAVYATVSILFALITYLLKIFNVEQFIQAATPYLQFFATIISICAGIMAIRHYYLQNKKPTIK